MSLLDEIKNLRRDVPKIFKAEFNPQMNELEKFLVGKIIDKPAPPPEDFLKPLLAKFLRPEDFFLFPKEFSSRELRSLPFIIYEPPITSSDTAKILRLMDFSRTSHLRNVVYVYLYNYDDSEKTDCLRQLLYNLREVDMPSLRKIFAAREYFFGNQRFENMAKLFAQRMNIDSVFDELGLSSFYKSSNFIQTALKMFFRADKPLTAQLKILQEIDSANDTYQNIFTVAADELIQRVAVNRNVGKPICLEIFYRRLGDPRFGNRRFNWDAVSKNSREIFCRWLVEEDFNVFFEIVNQTTNDPRWQYRRDFWLEYLDNKQHPIINTWVYFNPNSKARRIAAMQSKRNYGRLTNAGGNAAVFVFQIGRYVFSEWSNVGSVRAYSSAHENFFFGQYAIDGNDIQNKFVAKTWAHHSPQTNFWQKKLEDWINRHC